MINKEEDNRSLGEMSKEEMAEMIFQTEKGLVILKAALNDRIIKEMNIKKSPKKEIII